MQEIYFFIFASCDRAAKLFKLILGNKNVLFHAYTQCLSNKAQFWRRLDKLNVGRRN